jgi:hypothetical protein
MKNVFVGIIHKYLHQERFSCISKLLVEKSERMMVRGTISYTACGAEFPPCDGWFGLDLRPWTATMPARGKRALKTHQTGKPSSRAGRFRLVASAAYAFKKKMTSGYDRNTNSFADFFSASIFKQTLFACK